MAVIGSYRGPGRLRLLQAHRLLEFERTFSLYLAGRASAAEVKRRATKMLACGLPDFALPGGKGRSYG